MAKKINLTEKKDENAEWKIENVVATAKFNIGDGESKIDLNAIARKYPNCEYNPERFPGLVMRIPDPKSTVLVFGTGKMVITGMTNASMLPGVLEKVIENLKNAKIQIDGIAESMVQNIVASGNLKTKIDLNEAAIIMDNAMYEPEVFPGLIYRMATPKCVFLIFSTGKIVCTGAKTEEMVREGIKKLQKMVYELEINGEEFESVGMEDLDEDIEK